MTMWKVVLKCKQYFEKRKNTIMQILEIPAVYMALNVINKTFCLIFNKSFLIFWVPCQKRNML